MKSLFLNFLMVGFMASLLPAQNHVNLHLSPRIGNHAFALNTVFTATAGYPYKITRLEYYISEITITHDGGQVLPLTDVWLLVNPATDSLYDLGVLNIDHVEHIQFSLGVDPAHNHLDPATYPAGHPLAPQNPSMHWGWASGYRFAAFEGFGGVSGTPNHLFEVHTIGDANYKTVTLATGAEQTGNTLTIHLEADYAGLLNNINVSGGTISHASTGASAILINNLKNLVFTAETSGLIDPAFPGSFAISPNPGPADAIRFSFDLPAGQKYRLTVTDPAGRPVIARVLPTGTSSTGIDQALTAGVYFVHLWQNEKPVFARKLVVTK